jgi:replicative DNA helicase
VGRVTLDMTRRRLLARAACRKAGVSLPKLKHGFAGKAQLAQIEEAARILMGYPMFINERDRDLRAICTWARAEKMRHDIKLLTIDYVQQIQVTDGARNWSTADKLSHASLMLKGLALELAIPVIVLSQLNRSVEQSERIPRLDDLRGSGSLEQDASIVIMSYKDEKVPEVHNRTPQWLDVAKDQDGETGTIPFWFRRAYFLFDEAPPGFAEEKTELAEAKTPEWAEMEGHGMPCPNEKDGEP